MNPVIVQAVVRHLLTTVGGGFFASFGITGSALEAVVGAVAMIVLGTWAYLKLNNLNSDSVDNFAAAVGFYLFGDRTLFYARKAK